MRMERSHRKSLKPQQTIKETNRFKVEISAILEKYRMEILDEYYYAYCHYIKEICKAKRQNIDYLKKVCLPVKQRFSFILDRFIWFLTNGANDYDLRETEQDVSYALRFVVPGVHRDLGSHDIIKMTESFVNIATSKVLDSIDQVDYPVDREAIINIMDKLIYIVFEDLWVSSVAGFRHHSRMIRELLSKLMKTQEEERKKLSAELHDDFLQVLATIPVRIQIMEEHFFRKDMNSMQQECGRLLDLVNEAIQEVRSLCSGLHSFWAEKKGFVFSLGTFAKRMEKDFRIPIGLEIQKELNEEIKGFSGVTLFRIIQEALYNIGKHSKSRKAKVKVTRKGSDLLIVIEDDGIGFEPMKTVQNASIQKHFGLMSMRERTKLLGGRLKITSNQGHGTKITVSVPLKPGNNGGGRTLKNSKAV